MNRSRWARLLAATLFVVLLLLNLYVFFTREWESSYYPSTYATLYYPLDDPTIREWKLLDRNRIQLDLSCVSQVQSWQVLTDGRSPQTALGMQPSFHIDTTFAQRHAYQLVPVPPGACRTIDLTIQFYPTEFYASLGMKHDDVYIVRANVPCGDFEQFAVADWVDDYGYVGRESLAAVDRAIQKEVGITDADPAFTRMEKLTRFLKGRLANIGGVPKDDERWMNPWLLYNELVAGTGKGWCTQNAQVWVFWANRAGIPTRFVFGARTQDNTIVYTGHSWAECYIGEQHRWAFMDFMDGLIYVTDRNGLVLNSAELLQLNQHNAFDSTFARVFVDRRREALAGPEKVDSIVTLPLNRCTPTFQSEFTSHAILKYRRPPNVEDVREIYTGFVRDRTFLLGNLERYLFKPPLAYSFYPTDGAKIYLLRRLLFFAMLGALGVWAALALMSRRKKRMAAEQMKTTV